MQKSGNLRRVIIIISVVIIALILLILSKVMDKMPLNEAGTVGNTAGNINNMGLVCEKDGMVYFSNSFDGGSLYAMDIMEGNIHRISNVVVCNLLTGGDYVYYFQLGTFDAGGFENVTSTHGFNRYDLKKDRVQTITKDVVVRGQLVDNDLYLLFAMDKGPEFHKIRIDKSYDTKLASYEINPACAKEGIIYYNGTKDNHYLYTLDTSNDVSNLLLNTSLWYPVLYDNYIYFMDVENNYRLCRYSLADNVIQVLTNDRVDCFNVNEGYIYYQKNGTDPQLKFMRVDGTEETVLADGNYTRINMTSEYVYFQEFGIDSYLFHSRIGSADYSEFSAAKDAAQRKK